MGDAVSSTLLRERMIEAGKSGMLAGVATLALLFAGATSATAQITIAKPMPQTVTVHVADYGVEKIPDTIFGSFLEPIGNSINNGIAAEILVNRSFEGGLWNHVNLEDMFREQPD